MERRKEKIAGIRRSVSLAFSGIFPNYVTNFDFYPEKMGRIVQRMEEKK